MIYKKLPILFQKKIANFDSYFGIPIELQEGEADLMEPEVSEIKKNQSVEQRQLQLGRNLLQKPNRFAACAFIAENIPGSYEDAISSAEASKWQKAMVEEMTA